MTDQPRILAVANQKGGVGKTTTTINLGAALAEAGARVLIVDLDPQGNASTGVGVEMEDRKVSTYDVLTNDVSLANAAIATADPDLMIVPATTDLSSADIELISNESRSLRLRNALRDVSVGRLDLDFILIDCPPSLNILTVNALVGADAVVVPLQSEFFALEGLSQLLLTVREVRQAGNPDLRIEGIVLTMSDRRNNLSRQVEADARDNLGELVFQTVIPRNVRLSEAPSHAMPVLRYDPRSAGASAYRQLAKEILGRELKLTERTVAYG